MTVLTRVLAFVAVIGLLPACTDELSSEDHLNAAGAYLESGDPQSAVVELKNALQKDAGNTAARARLGELYFDEGEYQGARKELSLALESGAERTLVLPMLAQIMLQLGQYDELAKLYLGGLDPESRSVVQAAQGLALLFQGDPGAGQGLIDAALENRSVSPYAQLASVRLAMANRDYAGARLQLQTVLDAHPDNASAWYLLGDIESAGNHFKKAEAAYSRAIDNAPRDFDARLGRAMMRIFQRNIEGARKDLRQLNAQYRGVAKAHPGVQFAWGVVHLEGRNLDKARVSFETASQFPEQYPFSFFYLAAIDYENGNIEQATANVTRLLGLVPGSVPGRKLAAKLELLAKEYSKAEMLLEPLLEALPDDVEALNLMASALLAQGKGGEGVEVLARVVELQPGSAEAKARLGAGFMVSGDGEKGVAILQDILKEDPEYEQADILIILSHLRKGEYQAAIASAQAYRERNPGSTTSYNLLGRAYRMAGEQTKAREAFNKALELRPGDPSANHSLAAFALEQKDYELARRHYNQVLSDNPEHMQTMLKIASSYAMEGREEDMISSLRATLAAHPRAVEPRLVMARYHIARGQPEKVESQLEGLAQDQLQSPVVLETMASYELAVGRHSQALQTLDKLTRLRPRFAQYHYLKARAYAGMGDEERSIGELELAIELDPAHFYARLALARLALRNGDEDSFGRTLAELETIAPKHPEVLKLEAIQAQAQGDSEYAQQLLESLYEQAHTVENLRALAKHQHSAGDAQGAISLFEAWLEEFPRDAEIRQSLAQYYAESGQHEQVQAEYRKILDIDANDVVALNNLAWYLLEEDPVQALKYAERANSLSPDSSSVLDTLAMAQMKNAMLPEARRNMDRALSLSPGSPDLNYHDAQLMAAEGNPEAALRAVSDLLEQHPDFVQKDAARSWAQDLRRTL